MDQEGKKNNSTAKPLTYKDSGVDVEKADKLVEWMKDSSKSSSSPHQERLISGIGGFAALFDGRFPEMKKPALVSSTDGIGTKLLMGIKSGRIKGLAQDLVGMCVNDLLCTGATPLFFLDYFATSHLNEEALKIFFSELKSACDRSGVLLIGGETAEVPGLYEKEHFDAAGFSVGVVDEPEAWSPNKVKAGDVLIGVGSSGFHSNGYSLLRKIFGEDGGEFAEKLMTPTKLYWPLVKELQKVKSQVHAAAHITGGGMDNVSRVLPKGLGAKIDDWQWDDIFIQAQKKSQLTKNEMLKTFNCGLGFVFVIKKEAAIDIKTIINKAEGFNLITEGVIVESDQAWSVA